MPCCHGRLHHVVGAHHVHPEAEHRVGADHAEVDDGVHPLGGGEHLLRAGDVHGDELVLLGVGAGRPAPGLAGVPLAGVGHLGGPDVGQAQGVVLLQLRDGGGGDGAPGAVEDELHLAPPGAVGIIEPSRRDGRSPPPGRSRGSAWRGRRCSGRRGREGRCGRAASGAPAGAGARAPLPLQGVAGRSLHGAGGEGGVEALGEAEADDAGRVVQLHVPGELPRRQLRQVGGHLRGAGPGAGAPLLRDLQVVRVGVHQGQGAPQDDVAYAGVERRFEEDVGAPGGAVEHLGRGVCGHGAGEGEGGQVHDGPDVLRRGGRPPRGR